MIPECKNSFLKQTISREVALAWLAGFLEGEGCIFATFTYINRKDGSRRRILHTRVLFANTDARPLNVVAQHLLQLNVNFCWSLATNKNNGRRSCAHVIVHGQRTVMELLKMILPYLSGKRLQAEKVIEIINKRQEIPYGTYNERIDWPAIERMISECKELRSQRVDPSTTTRHPSDVLRW